MSRSVLVVDNDPEFLDLVVGILTDIGIEPVMTAVIASQALLVAQDVRPDAALVDIALPDRDGSELAYELSALPWHPRVVLTSTDSEAFHAIEPRAGRGELAFIAKAKLTVDTLREALFDR